MAQERRNTETRDSGFAVMVSSLKVGAVCGGAGFLFGGTAGILRGTTPLLFATASSIQTFALGTTFWTCRTNCLNGWFNGSSATPRDRIKASTLAGGLSGASIALLTRGSSNLLPGAVMFSLFGCLGQITYNRFSAQPATKPKEPFWKRMAQKSWSPVTVMSNEEYADMLREKMLKADVEIAVLEDTITALRKQQHDEQHDVKDVGRPTDS